MLLQALKRGSVLHLELVLEREASALHEDGGLEPLFDVSLDAGLLFFPVLLELLLELAHAGDGVEALLGQGRLLLQPLYSKAKLSEDQAEVAWGPLGVEGLLALGPEQAVGRGCSGERLGHVCRGIGGVLLLIVYFGLVQEVLEPLIVRGRGP